MADFPGEGSGRQCLHAVTKQLETGRKLEICALQLLFALRSVLDMIRREGIFPVSRPPSNLSDVV